MEDKKIFFVVMAKLQKYFGKTLEDEILDLYWEHLQRINEAAFKAASVRMLSDFQPTSTKPFPLIADFLAMCGEGAKTKAINIVSAVKRAAESIGQYASVDFNDKAIHSVINRYGGWPDIVSWGERDWQFHERNFIAAYEAAQLLGVGSSHVMGLVELQNGKDNLPYEEPIKVCSKTGDILAMPKETINQLVKKKQLYITEQQGPRKQDMTVRQLLNSDVGKTRLNGW